jgi:ribonuclease Z
MLEIVILGTGSGIPTKRRNHPAIWLRHEGHSFLWDCGEGTQRQLMSARLSFMKVDRIFITHWHADHWAGLLGLLQTMNLEKRKKSLQIYAPDAERFVSDILDLDYWGPRFKVLAANVPYEGSSETKLFSTKDFEISSIPVEHTVPAVAYCFKEKDRWNVDIEKMRKLYGLGQSPLVGKLKKRKEIVFKGQKIRMKDVGILKKGVKVVYSGDTIACRNLERLSKGADVLICDATFEAERESRMHSGAKEAAQIAKKTGVKQLVLTHFSRRYTSVKPLLEEAKKIFPNTAAAEDFMKIELKGKD